MIQKPLFRTRIARPWLKGQRARYPFVQPDGRSYTYDYSTLPVHRHLLDHGIMIHGFSPFNTPGHIREVAAGIRKVFTAYARTATP
jgi:hypothetical protein